MNAVDLDIIYRLNTPDIVTEDFDGQSVVLNLANGHYYSLEGIAGQIWQMLIDGYRPCDILATIAAARADLVVAATGFLRQVIDLNLVKPAESDAAPRLPPDESWSGDAPRLVIYEDLAELIYADPIHDVDEEAGWPMPRSVQ